MDPFRSVIAFDQKHSQEIGIAPIGMEVCSRDKTSYPHGIYQPVILLKNDMDIAIGKQKKMYYLIRKVEFAHGMAKGKYGYCCHKGDHG